jgi:hypothetical protein
MEFFMARAFYFENQPDSCTNADITTTDMESATVCSVEYKKHGRMTVPNNTLGIYCMPAQLENMFWGSSAWRLKGSWVIHNVIPICSVVGAGNTVMQSYNNSIFCYVTNCSRNEFYVDNTTSEIETLYTLDGGSGNSKRTLNKSSIIYQCPKSYGKIHVNRKPLPDCIPIKSAYTPDPLCDSESIYALYPRNNKQRVDWEANPGDYYLTTHGISSSFMVNIQEGRCALKQGMSNIEAETLR